MTQKSIVIEVFNTRRIYLYLRYERTGNIVIKYYYTKNIITKVFNTRRIYFITQKKYCN